MITTQWHLIAYPTPRKKILWGSTKIIPKNNKSYNRYTNSTNIQKYTTMIPKKTTIRQDTKNMLLYTYYPINRNALMNTTRLIINISFLFFLSQSIFPLWKRKRYLVWRKFGLFFFRSAHRRDKIIISFPQCTSNSTCKWVILWWISHETN